MIRRLLIAGCVVIVAAVPSAVALTASTDVLVVAASRGGGASGSTWVTDLCLFNPGALTASGTVAWMVRNAANPSPQTFAFALQAGETLCLEDVILSKFGLTSGNGAFRVRSDRAVVATSRIYNLKNGVTFGQGFEGVARDVAVAAGGSADVVGLTQNASFRTNVVLMDASGSGSTIALTLFDETGTQIGARTYTLAAFEPKLFPVTDLGVATLDLGTLHADVISGAAVVVGSKIDNDTATGDPTTLAAAVGGTNAGTYQFGLYDSLGYASGGAITVADDDTVTIDGSFFNFDKVDAQQLSECVLVFLWGANLPSATTVADLAQGVSFSDAYTDSGTITYTVQLSFSAGLEITGTVAAVGVNFPSNADPILDESGCNGTFPPLTLRGGKRN